jgi:hypothetical protein
LAAVNDFGRAKAKDWNSAPRVRPLIADRPFFPSAFQTRKLSGRDHRLGRELAPLVLTRRSNAGAPNREQLSLVQYPHNSQKPGNSGDCDQECEYRYLPAVELIVLGQSCLAMV